MSQELLSAVYEKDLIAIERLAERGENINQRDEDGRTALMHAVLAEDATPDFVEFLIANGVDVDASDQAQEWTALHFAARDQKPKIVKAIIEGGAQIDPLDVYGNTPLWRCVMNSSPNETVVKLLLEHGADPNKKNYKGVSPRDLARKLGHKMIVDMFRDEPDG